MIHDYLIIGGGIVGLATAKALLERRPGASLLLIEKEAGLGHHQTGHNSGVIHSGIYYAPGSLKAALCRAGAAATERFCEAQAVPFERCGKYIVATTALEAARMAALEGRAAENGLVVERLSAAALREREPAIRGVGALFVASTGIVDYRRICAALADVIRAAGGTIVTGVAVDAIRERAREVVVEGGGQSWQARQLVACAGVQADRIARLAGLDPGYRILPFRGEYYRLPPARNGIVRGLIYPVPDPELPFLGIHLTRMIDGGVTVGPNAVLGLAREGYPKFSISPRDVADYLAFPGFWRLIARYRRSAAAELKNSLSKRAYLAACRKYCPDLGRADLLPAPAGIRAQLVLRDGTLLHDFHVEQTGRMLHVANAPSPAATAALPIGAMIADRCLAAAG